MKQTNPPRAATWALHHLAGERDEALAGDLLEEFRSGRSTGWYWRQALAAVAIGWAKQLLNRMDALVFAALWATLANAWVLEWRIHLRDLPWLLAGMWGLAYPWSMICNFVLLFSLDLAFVWTGLLVFLALEVGAAGGVNLRKMRSGILRSVPAFIAVWMVVLTLTPIFPHHAYVADWRAMKPMSALTDFDPLACLARLPFFVATLLAIWGVSRTAERTQLTAKS